MSNQPHDDRINGMTNNVDNTNSANRNSSRKRDAKSETTIQDCSTHLHLDDAGLILLHFDEIAHDERPETTSARAFQATEWRQERRCQDRVQNGERKNNSAHERQRQEWRFLRLLNEGMGSVWVGLDPTDESSGAVHGSQQRCLHS